jgi:hypothetical protein
MSPFRSTARLRHLEEISSKASSFLSQPTPTTPSLSLNPPNNSFNPTCLCPLLPASPSLFLLMPFVLLLACCLTLLPPPLLSLSLLPSHLLTPLSSCFSSL